MIRCALFLGILAALAPAQEAKTFRAGAAASNITPPLGEPIVGGWSSPPATKIHDELHALCFARDDRAGREGARPRLHEVPHPPDRRRRPAGDRQPRARADRLGLRPGPRAR